MQSEASPRNDSLRRSNTVRCVARGKHVGSFVRGERGESVGERLKANALTALFVEKVLEVLWTVP